MFCFLNFVHHGKFPPDKSLPQIIDGKETVTHDIVTPQSSSHMKDYTLSLVSPRDATRRFACVTLYFPCIAGFCA